MVDPSCDGGEVVVKCGGMTMLDNILDESIDSCGLVKVSKMFLRGVYIHPEHCIEYNSELLKHMQRISDFEIKHAYRICEMPNTLDTGKFCYEDFMFGGEVTDDVTNGYIQFFHCVKP